MKSLYLILDGAIIFFPLLLSFDKKVHFFKYWIAVFIASFLVSCPFIIWDYIFTETGIWGFNDAYLSGVFVRNLPIEEILFFFTVPFACTFIYMCCKVYFKSSDNTLNLFVQAVLFLYIVSLLLMQPSGVYTIVVSIIGLFVLFWWVKSKIQTPIGLAFLFSLIPFLIVNGILTGAVTDSPIVWYSEADIVPYRILTIPMEDVVYSFTLIVGTILTFEQFFLKHD